MRIKICGITRKEDARFAELAGADAIGVVMFSPSSPRSVTEEKAREIFGALGPFVTRVIVTHTRSDDDLKRILTLRPDAIQISHPFVFAEAPGARVLRVIGRGDAGPADCDAVIVDESMGAGRHFDRAFAKEIVAEIRGAGHPCRGAHPGKCRGRDPGDPALRCRCRKRCRRETGNKGSQKNRGFHRRSTGGMIWEGKDGSGSMGGSTCRKHS